MYVGTVLLNGCHGLAVVIRYQLERVMRMVCLYCMYQQIDDVEVGMHCTIDKYTEAVHQSGTNTQYCKCDKFIAYIKRNSRTGGSGHNYI